MRLPAIWAYRPRRGPLRVFVRLARWGRLRLNLRVL